MKTLALELSTARGSLAWFNDLEDNAGEPATQILEWPNDRKNSAMFFENLQRTVHQFGSPEKIVVGLGPGSYAGVRIAIAAATGLATASRAELIGYPSIAAMPNQTGDYAVIGDARRRSFFFVRIRNRTVSGDYDLLGELDLIAQIEGLERDVPVLSSDALPQFQPRVEQRYPSAEILGQLGADTNFFRMPLEPIYLREANVTIPKPIKKGPGQ